MTEAINVCKNCGTQFTGRYCNQCGEKVYTEHDKSALHFFEDAVHFVSHFEGTFFVTLKAILSKPGKLSRDYCNGLRKKYFKPLPFFMLLVILYLIFPFFTGLNMPFRLYLGRGYANEMIKAKTGIDGDSLYQSIQLSIKAKKFASQKEVVAYEQTLGDSVKKVSPRLYELESTYNRKSEKVSKFLLLILLPLTALAIWLLSLRKSNYFFDQLILATEINSFYIMFTFFFVPLVAILFFKLFPGIAPYIFRDGTIGIACYFVVGVFSAIAFRRFYNDGWVWSVIKAVLMMFAHYFIVQVIYKFILFVLTFYLSA
jgi:hypothetical protein